MRRFATIGILLLASASAGCAGVVAPDSSPPSGTPTGSPTSVVTPRSVFVVGDSNSTGFRGTLAEGLDAGEAWAAALPDSFFPIVQGWARDGATTADMRQAVRAGARADVLLIMAGTNDLIAGLAADAILAHVADIADGVESPTVVLLAVAPLDALASEAAVLNDAFESLARENGWDFLDPWAGMRRGDGTWIASWT
ncbi:hypothetical protein DBR36_09540, partial [Microbacterium sp. HMWF026]|uniref:SGNH/GDSL hydrolase family protein n=1 Tax=Microbacterium sp. HMWF026 TaxID=2056861 RepID=UPI000D49D7B2